ncbi:MAG: hypothetical protein ACRC78_04150 [Planktothrix sp.]
METQKEITTPIFDMNKAMAYLLNVLQNQGPSFLIMGLAVWYLQGQNIELRQQVSNCQYGQIEMLTTQNQQMIKVIEQNTLAIQNLKK